MIQPQIILKTFEDHVRDYLGDCQEQFNYEVLVKNHTDSSRFGPWVAQAGEYRPVKGAHVFSSGCGSGGDIATFLEQGADKVSGIEVEPGLVELAKKRFAGTEFEKKVTLNSYPGDFLPYANDTFDIVFSLHVIEHTKNVPLYLLELFRVLKKDGIIFLDVPNRYFKTEQHTNLPYIHFVPRPLRNLLVRILLKIPSKFDDSMRFKIGTMYEYHIPAPKTLVSIVNKQAKKFDLQIADAFFHSYDLEQLPYKDSDIGYFSGRARDFTTFRLVVRKC